MKNLLTAILLLVGSLRICGDVIDFEARDQITPFPHIIGDLKSQNGKTDCDSVHCLLTSGNLNAKSVFVTGTLTVSKGLIDPERGVHLTAFDIDGNTQHTVASWEIAGHEKNGEVQYEFRIGGELTKTAKLYLFTKKEGMMVLELKTLPIIKK
jgi:hypothetical protein